VRGDDDDDEEEEEEEKAEDEEEEEQQQEERFLKAIAMMRWTLGATARGGAMDGR
jgi:TATA-binding protein-associated factor Taf7